jgi:recombination protein RecT
MTSTEIARAQPSQPVVRDLIVKQRDQLARALPNQLSVDRFLRLIATELRTVPNLELCTVPSLLGAVMHCAQLGVEPGGPLGMAWILPFKNNKSGQYEATFVLGYKGIIALAYRSDRIAAIVARAVKDGDQFDYELGLAEDRLVHRPRLDGPRGKSYAWYGVARIKGGGQLLTVMGRPEIEERRQRSKSPDSPAWRNDYDAMACKTVIRAMAPFLPLTAESARAIEEDETVIHMGADGRLVDPETGEIEEPSEQPAAQPREPVGDDPF